MFKILRQIQFVRKITISSLNRFSQLWLVRLAINFTMEESAQEPKRASQIPAELKSQVELSFVALNLGELKLSDASIAKASSDGERHSLLGKQIKVRVKTYQPQPPLPSTGEEEEDQEASEKERYEENEDEQEISGSARLSGISQEIPPLFNNEDEYDPATTAATTRPFTSRRSTSLGEAEDVLLGTKEAGEGEDDGEEDEERPSYSEPPGEEEALKKENTHSTLIEKECVVPEVLVVWEYVCKFIIEKMLEGFAVRVPGLGTFTHSTMPSDILKKPEHGKFSLRKTRKYPIFKICSYLKEMYRLAEENHLFQCNAPTVPLNIAVVASNAKLSPGIVEGIIIETLQSFVTGIITNKYLEFPFPYIGKLFIKNRKVFMIFYRQFCEGLSFDFNYAPSYIFSVIPGSMTPLAYHRPAEHFHSVFHFCDVRSVENKITARPTPYARGGLIRDDHRLVHPCEFVKNLYTHSNLLYDCSCCDDDGTSKRKSMTKPDDESDTFDGLYSPPCGYSKNYDRIKKACCTETGTFIFQKPDGSFFSPEPLFKTAKTGNPILDRLAVDRCLLQQAIGCWMSRKVVHTLGKETIAKHHDREYFRKRLRDENAGKRGFGRKSYLVRDTTGPPSSGSLSPSESSVHRRSVNSGGSIKLSSRETSIASDGEELFFAMDEEEDGEAIDEIDEPAMSDMDGSINSAKTVRSKSFRTSKAVPVEPVQAGGEEQGEKRKRSSALQQEQQQQQRRSRDSRRQSAIERPSAEFEQNDE